MKADFSAGEVRGEACWGGAAEERSSSILPSHQLFGLVCGFELQNGFILAPPHSVYSISLFLTALSRFIPLLSWHLPRLLQVVFAVYGCLRCDAEHRLMEIKDFNQTKNISIVCGNLWCSHKAFPCVCINSLFLLVSVFSNFKVSQTPSASEDHETWLKASEKAIKGTLSVPSWIHQTLSMNKHACFHLMNATWSA